MNIEKMDIEQMKKAWLAMGESLGIQLPPDNSPEQIRRKKTALDRLRDKYRMFIITSLLMVFGSFMIFSRGMIVESHLNFWLGVAYAIYFLTCFIMDKWLYHGIGTIDPLCMSVTQVVNKSLFYKKRHLQFMAILIPMAIALLSFTAYVFSAEKYMIIGMITGAILGATLGVIQFRRFMSEYRKLSE